MNEKTDKIINNLKNENELLKPVQQDCETQCNFNQDCEQKEKIDKRIKENENLINLNEKLNKLKENP